jgi:hypothetical protein
MTRVENVLADTVFWAALIIKQDQFHSRASRWALQIDGTIATTTAVLLETANMLSRLAWRHHAVMLMDHLQRRNDVEVIPTSADLWNRGRELYRNRMDKEWSLTDCISFTVMQDRNIDDCALTADEHFQQAGFQALLLRDP